MKDSGIEWIGEIPESWSVRPAKYAFTEIREKNTDGKIQLALQFKNGSIIRKNNFEADSDDYVADTILNYTIVEPNTIMINGLNLNYDLKSLRVAIVREKGIITSAYLALKPDETKISPEFANYLFKGYESKMAFHNMGAGIRLTLGFKEFKNQPVLFPETYEEQLAISAYLDRQCALIDSVTEKTKASIEEYKKLRQAVITQAVTKGVRGDSPMKDSGIEWIGKIPEEWEVLKTVYLFKENVRTPDNDAISLSLSQTDGLIPTDDMKESSLKTSTYDGWKQVRLGDLVLNRFKGHLGVLYAAWIEGMVSFHYGVYEPQTDLVTKYYEYLFHSDCYKAILGLKSNGMTIGLQNLSNQNFYSIMSLYPSPDEQHEIVDYLDQKSKEISALIAKKETFLTELEAYKKSLIYEYVTGKKEVPQA